MARAFSNSSRCWASEAASASVVASSVSALCYVEFIADAAVEAAAHQAHLFLAQINRAVHGGDFRVERPEPEIILRDVGLESQQDIVEGRQRALGVGARAFETAAHAAPQINFVTQVQRRRARCSPLKRRKLGCWLGE